MISVENGAVKISGTGPETCVDLITAILGFYEAMAKSIGKDEALELLNEVIIKASNHIAEEDI